MAAGPLCPCSDFVLLLTVTDSLTLIGDPAHLTAPPTKVRFSATLSRGTGGGCSVTVGAGGEFPTLEEAIKSLLDVPKDFKDVDVCICLLPSLGKQGLQLIKCNYCPQAWREAGSCSLILWQFFKSEITSSIA